MGFTCSSAALTLRCRGSQSTGSRGWGQAGPPGVTSSEPRFAFLPSLTPWRGWGACLTRSVALNLDPRHVPLAATLFWQPPGPACLSKWPPVATDWAARAGASQPRTPHPTCLSVAAPSPRPKPLTPPDPQRQEPRRWPRESGPGPAHTASTPCLPPADQVPWLGWRWPAGSPPGPVLGRVGSPSRKGRPAAPSLAWARERSVAPEPLPAPR